MFQFLVRRTILNLLIVLGAMIIVFTLVRMIPMNILEVLLGPYATPEMIAQIQKEMGMNKPFFIQLGEFLFNTFQGDLGTDIMSHRPISNIMLHNLSYTVSLAFSSIAFASIFGIPLGLFAAAYKNSVFDKITGAISVIFVTVPSFVRAILIIFVFAVILGWFPIRGAGDPGNILDQIWHLILPAVSLGLGWLGYFARIMRASVLEELTKDHIRTARAKGVSRVKVLIKHAARSALIPVVAVMGVGFGKLLGGQVLIEIIYHRPGLGNVLYQAIQNRNFPIIEGGLVIVVFLYATVNMLVDFLHGTIDPRIRYD